MSHDLFFCFYGTTMVDIIRAAYVNTCVVMRQTLDGKEVQIET